MSLRYATGALVAIVAAAIALAGMSSSASPARRVRARPDRLLRAHGPKPITVPLKVRWSGAFAAPMIEVRVGNGPAVPVLLDTGSTGLHIYTQGVKLGPASGVTVSGRSDSITYLDGSVQSGVIARAKLTIGGMRTRVAVPFGLIQRISCLPIQPDCPAAVGIGADIAAGRYGTLGVELERTTEGVANPLLALPAPYSHSWSISLAGKRGALVLGAQVPSHPSASFALRPSGRDPSGARAWDDRHATVCWAYAGMHGAACQPTIFDTGDNLGTLWFGGALSHAATEAATDLVTPGTFIAAWQPGATQPFWSFTSGEDDSTQMVGVFPGRRFAQGSVQAFFSARFTYDALHGRILISPR